MAVSLPLALLILDFYPLGRVKRIGALKRILIEKAILFVPCLFAMVMAIWSEGVVDPESMGAQQSTSFITRLLVSVRAFAFYIYKMVWPLDISPFYPYPSQADLFSVLTGLAIVLFLVSAFLALYFYRKRSYLGAAWLYYLITLLPVIGIVRIGIQGAADRYTYLPSISLFMLVGLLAYHLADRYSKRVIRTALVAVVVMAGLLAFKTSYQIQVWKDSVSLWGTVIEYTSETVALPYTYRGVYYREQGDYDSAVADFTKAIGIEPRSLKAYVNRAATYRKQGAFYKAIGDNLKVIELSPGKATAYNNLGAAYASVGNFVEAQKSFRIATELDPTLLDAQNNLKRVLMLEPSR
jgi:tetratricopeptide (TPR) repeat protein